jgi:protein-S-isoprenylcysteine O-methyltransferase Ste14
MPFDVRTLISLAWVIFFAIWILWGITAKRAIRQQSVASRFAQGAVSMLAFWVLLSPSIRLGPLALRILPHSIVTEAIAIVFTILGFALCIWARLHLGGNWSATVTVKQDHRLITTGPYAFVRHPIYSGVSLAGLGIAVLNGDLRSIAGLALMVLGWRMKFRLEEQFMTEQFGTQYLDYMKRVKALVPFVW